MGATPEDPRLARQRVLAGYLWFALGVTMLLGLATVVAPESWVDTLGPTMVGVLILAPVGRVVWLLVRWTRRGDRKYALAAIALLGVMVVALVLAH